MAYLTRADLTTHIYPEIIKSIIRDFQTDYANLAGFPAIGIAGRRYKALDTAKVYIWNDDDAYEETEVFDLVSEAIDSAIADAKGYLSRFDLLELFGDEATEATVVDKNLKNKVKDLACWQLIKLSNPSIDLALFRTAYEDAIKLYFEKIQAGKIDPQGWVYKTDDDATGYNENNNVQYTTNNKRDNHY